MYWCREAIEIYTSEVRKVAVELLRSLSSIMGMDKDVLLELHQELNQFLSVGYYPSCSMPDKVLGASPHADKDTITILMQDDNLTGLQVKQDGNWVPVKPIPNAFIVNVGDLIEVYHIPYFSLTLKVEKIMQRSMNCSIYIIRLSFIWIISMTDME